MRIIFLLFLSGYSSLLTSPDQLSFIDRRKEIKKVKAPVSNSIMIHWNQYAVPFIFAKTDADLAFAIGFLHGHLRIDQLELMRRVSQGRLSEMLGPIPVIQKIDQGLRTIDFLGAGKASLQKMKPESRQWLQQFTKGLNWYISHLKHSPVTNQFIGQKLKTYREEELMAIGKLASADLNWMIYLTYLRHAGNKNWEKTFLKFLDKNGPSVSSYPNSKKLSLEEIFQFLSRSGSNSLVIAGKKSQTGSALIANDPHVGTVLPSFWLMMGVKSPSYHAVGLMVPGLPFIGTGRNKHISWGGTNIRGISSHLYDVSDVKNFKTRKERIKRRAWFPLNIEIKSTPFGPVLTDKEFLSSKKNSKIIALDWLGRKGTDEMTAFLKVMKSKNWSDFKKAFVDYQIPALSMLYADTKGNIGLVPAYGQPILKNPKETLNLVKSPKNPIIAILSPKRNLTAYNPAEAFIASANNRPFKNPAIPFSFNYSNNDRVLRMQELVKQKQKLSVEDLKKIQQDVFSKKSYQLKQIFFTAIKEYPLLLQNPQIKELKTWTGHYESHSRPAVIFYALMSALWTSYKKELDKNIIEKISFYNEYWKEVLIDWIPTKKPEEIYEITKESLSGVDKTLVAYPTWGDFTVQAQQSPLGRIPVIGSKFNLKTYPARGESDTLDKKGRSLSQKKSLISYGSSARHISDMSDPDENYFVLNGGQDSWLMNENLGDQSALWIKGEYLKIPLRPKNIKKHFKAYQSQIDPL